MKIKMMFLSLSLVSAGFCIDENQPIAPQKLQIDLGFNPTISGHSVSVVSTGVTSYGVAATPLMNVNAQVKYGIMTGLDLEAGWTGATYSSPNGSDVSGFLQPDFALKYAVTQLGIGVFADVLLPWAAGDFKTTPLFYDLGIAPGVVYNKTFGNFQATGLASYLINIKNEDHIQEGNVLTVYLKPGYAFTNAISGYLGLKYQMFGKAAADGNDEPNSDGHLFTVAPGVVFWQSEMISYDFNILMTNSEVGTENQTFWGVSAAIHMTLL